MRRQYTPINVWPAFADLMTVLAVVGLTLAVGVVILWRQDRQTVEATSKQRDELRSQIDKMSKDLEQQRRELARNRSMFQAIQRVQQIIEEISKDRRLEFGPDQSLQFDELVSFEINKTNPELDPKSAVRLRRFCQRLTEELGSLPGQEGHSETLFLVHVEGHTDSNVCRGDPLCNWDFSADRATRFAKLMMDARVCPGGDDLTLIPIAYADTRPPIDDSVYPRRVSLRLVPDYQQLIRLASAEEERTHIVSRNIAGD